MSVTILQAAQEANTAAGIRNFAFANLTEFNSFKDGFNELEYPINVMVPFTVNSQFLSRGIKNSVIIRGWVLTRLREDTNDFRSLKIEPDYINPMRVLAMTFVRRLLDSDVIDSEVENVNATFVPEYQFLDSHLFGVSYSLTLPTKAHIC
jgi:hypothetical protein